MDDTQAAARRALMEKLLRERAAQGQAKPDAGIPRRPRTGAEPASFAQERLWFLDRLEPGSAIYNIASMAELPAGDPELVRRALTEVVRRHESLRTTFALRDGRPVQIISPEPRVDLLVADLTALTPGQQDAEITRATEEESRQPYDLEHGPLLRARLLQVDAERQTLLLGMHHIVSDGWSIGVLFREIKALLEAYAAGRPSPLPELPLQYADYAAWQREQLTGAPLAKLTSYWRGAVGSAPTLLELPTDRPRPPVQTFRGSACIFRIPAATAAGLDALGRAEGATPFMVLLAAWGVLLSRYSGQDDLLVGSPIAGRTRSELEGLIGFFVNTLVLRCDLRGAPTFRQVVRRVKEVTLGAFAHQELPFERLVEELQPERSMAHSPLFQVLFVLQNTPQSLPQDAGEMGDDEMMHSSGLTGTSKFDVSLFAAAHARGGYIAGLEYNEDLFDAESIGRMAGHVRTLLAAAAADPDRPAATLPLLGADERAAVLAQAAGPAAPPPDAEAVHRLVEAQARRTPGAAALAWDGGETPYAALNASANRLARRLRELGVGPEVPVGVCLERSPEGVLSLLAVLKAGGCYVPLDPNYPAERLAWLAADSAAPVVITRRSLADRLPELDAQLVFVDEQEAGDAEDDSDLPPLARPENLAYVIYTSGSTGTPKGVALPHRVLLNLVRWQVESWDGDAARTAHFASPSFDVSLQEVLSTLASGGALVTVDDAERRDPAALLQRLRDSRVERLFVPPFYLQALAQHAVVSGDAVPPLREAIVAGERLQVTPALAQLAARSGAVLRNQYGPSETHVVTEHRLDGDPAAWPALPSIGAPLPGTRAAVLDAALQPVPVGASGELYLGGVCVARGYLNRPALTAERFMPDPYAGEPGARMYRTGDRARRLSTGEIEFLGRLDDQVKVRGFRVEPGEIEAALAAHPGVKAAAVAVRGATAADRALVGYVVAAGDEAPAPAELRSFLAGRLPEHLVPVAWMFVDALPLSPNGKVDRRALPAPEGALTGARAEYVAPRSPVEEKLAAIWSEVLNAPRVGIRDDFFDLGGHSLLATQLTSRIRNAFGVEIALRKVFESPTVEALATVVVQAQAAAVDPDTLRKMLEQIRAAQSGTAAAAPEA